MGYTVIHGEDPHGVTISPLPMREAVATARALLNEGKRPRLVDADGRTVSLDVIEPLIERRPYR